MAKFEEELIWAFGRLDELRRQYVWRLVEKEDQVFDVRRVDLLHRNVQQWLGVPISVEFLDVPTPDGVGAALLGACEIQQDGSYRIGVRAGLNRCWKRFVSAKEICHPIINKKEYHNLQLEPHIDGMTVAAGKNGGFALMAEELAEIVAMEYLFPFELRRAALATVINGDFLPVAQKYLVPLLLVEKYLSAHQLERIAPFRQSLKQAA